MPVSLGERPAEELYPGEYEIKAVAVKDRAAVISMRLNIVTAPFYETAAPAFLIPVDKGYVLAA